MSEKMPNKRLFLASPTMHGEELEFIHDAFDKNWIAPLGENVDEFEREVASFVGMPYALSLSSGTAALHLAFKLAGIGRDDIVLCSDLTFVATVSPVSFEGGKQVFIDCERETWNMDPQALAKALRKYDGSDPAYPKAKAVVLAHLYGTPAKVDEIKALCEEHEVPLIEDAAESLSSTYKGRQTGSLGDYCVLSFNGNKIITTSGGGMLLSHSLEDIDKARYWATQARDDTPWYEHVEIGYNYRMSNILAGIGRGQLLHLAEHKKRKEEIYYFYREQFAGFPLQMNPFLEQESQPNFWLSCILVDRSAGVTPEDIRARLEAENIESRPLWKPMHLQPIFRDNDFIQAAEEDVGKDLFERGLCLPSDIKMSEEEQRKVLTIVKDCFS